MKKNLFRIFLLVGMYFIVSSCEEKHDHLDFIGKDNAIVSFSFNNGDDVYPVEIYQDSLVFKAAYDLDFTKLKAEIVASEGVIITPDPDTINDWSNNIDFTLKAINGVATRQYRYIVHVAQYEKVCDEIVYLRTQTEVNDFGAQEYTVVKGIVIDSKEDDKIRDLSPLNTIEEIEYNLQIKDFYGKSLNGFENLKRITTFNTANDSIESLVFPNLEVVTNFLVGVLNDELNIGSVSQSLKEINCPKLTIIRNNLSIGSMQEDLKGFSNLSEVGGEILLNAKFSDMKGLEKLTELNFIRIVSPNLISLEGLENVKIVKNSFTLSFCQRLETLAGLNIENVKKLNINNCTSILDISALSKITTLDQLFLSGLPKLESLEGLHNIRTIKVSLELLYVGGFDYAGGWPYSTIGIENLDGLRGLESIGDKITIKGCRNLMDFSGISKLATSFKGKWEVTNCKYNPTWEDFYAGKYTQQ